MADSAYQKMWSWAALTYVTLVATFFARTTAGGEPSVLFGFIKNISASTVPSIGLPANLLAGLAMLALTFFWTRQHEQLIWAARLPCFHFTGTEVDPATRGGKVYRAATFWVVHGLTFVATAQMFFRYFDQPVYRCGGTAVIAGGVDHFKYALLKQAQSDGMLLCFGAPEAPETFALLPWVYVLLAILFCALWVWTAWCVFGRRGRPSQIDPPFPELDP